MNLEVMKSSVEKMISLLVGLFLLNFLIATPLIVCGDIVQMLNRFSGILALTTTLLSILIYKKELFNDRLFRFSLVLSVVSLINSLIFSPLNATLGYLYPFCIFGMSYAILKKNTFFAHNLSRCTMGMILILCAIFIYVGYNPNNTPIGLSRSGITVHLFFSFVLFEITTAILKLDRSKERWIWISLILMTAVWAQGRSSLLIVATTFVFLGYTQFKSQWKYFVTGAVLVIGFCFMPIKFVESNYTNVQQRCELLKLGNFRGVFAHSLDDFHAKISDKKFSYAVENGLSSPRYRIWFSYFRALNFKTIIGGDFESDDEWMLRSYKQKPFNFHNSFIGLHQYYGLFGFLIYLFLIYGASMSLYFCRKYWLLFLFFGILFRSAMDMILFQYLWDVLLWMFLLYSRNIGNEAKIYNYYKHILFQKN